MIWDTTSKDKITYISLDQIYVLEKKTTEKIQKKYLKKFLYNLFTHSNISLLNLHYKVSYLEQKSTYQIIYFYCETKNYITVFDSILSLYDEEENLLAISKKHFYYFHQKKLVLIEVNTNYSNEDISKYIEFLFPDDKYMRVEYEDESLRQSNIQKIKFKKFSTNKKLYFLFAYYLIFFIFLSYFGYEQYHKETNLIKTKNIKEIIDPKIVKNKRLIEKLNTIFVHLEDYKIKLIQIKYKKKFRFIFEGNKQSLIRLLKNQHYKFKIIEIKTNTNKKYLELELDG